MSPSDMRVPSIALIFVAPCNTPVAAPMRKPNVVSIEAVR